MFYCKSRFFSRDHWFAGASHFLLAVFSVVLFHLHGAAAEVPKFVGKPVEVVEWFQTDSRANYTITGTVDWASKLTLSKDASLAWVKSLESDFQCKFDFWPKEIREGEQSVTHINYLFSGGYQLVMVITRVRKNNQLLRQVMLAEVQNDPSKSEPVVEERSRSAIFSLSGDVEQWNLEYKNGVAHLSCNAQPVATACTNGLISWLNVLAVTQVSGSVEWSRFEIHGREAGYTKEQRDLYDRTNEMQAQAAKARAAGDVRLAVECEDKRIPLLEQAFGPDHVSIALLHERIGNIADSMNRPYAAKDRYQKAAEIFAHHVGEHHPGTLLTKVRIGYQLSKMGDPEAAENIAREAGIEYLRVAGPKGNGPKLIFVYLANIYDKQKTLRLIQANYRAYDQYCRELDEICTAVYGPDHSFAKKYQREAALGKKLVESPPKEQLELATLLLDIAKTNNLLVFGDTAGAHQFARERLPQCRKLLGNDDPITTDTLCFVGAGEMRLGNFASALQLLEEAVAIRKKTDGENGVAYAIAQSQLASCYSQVARFDEATSLFENASKIVSRPGENDTEAFANTQLEYGRHLIRIRRLPDAHKHLKACIDLYLTEDPTNPLALKAYDRMTELFFLAGDVPTAERLLEFQKQQLIQRGTNPLMATTDVVMQEAKLLYLKKQYSEAIAKYQEAIARIGSFYGTSSIEYGEAREGLLEVHLVQQNQKAAADDFGQMLEFARRRRESLFDVYTPTQQFRQSATDRIWLNRLMALASEHYFTADQAYEYLLEIKGAVTLHQRRTQLAASRPELKELVKRREDIGSRLATMIGRPLSADDTRKVEQLESDRDMIEREMSSRSAAYRSVSERLTIAKVRDLLPANVAVVDYVAFERPPSWLERLFSSALQRQLAAFVVTKKDGVQLFDLGPSAQVTQALHEWSTAIGAETANLGRDFDPRLEQNTDRAGIKVRNFIWGPIKEHLASAETIVICPDGVLVACPFPALPLDDKPTYLIENKALSQVAAVSLLPDLLNRKSDNAKSQLLVVGDIDYDATEVKDNAKNDVAAKSDLVSFQKLPLSNQAIAKIYKRQFPTGVVRELSGGNATESQVRQAISGSSMIYFNTHGFSVPLSILQRATQASAPANQFDFDPLVAGIALAGANHATSNKGADGILWASEIAMLNLEQTELVTLSACETALGDLIPGEGMQGSQRALTIAGAQASLASIWSVAAAPTDTIMDRFYEDLWTKKSSKAESLRQAMQHMIRDYDWAKGRSLPGGSRHRCPPWLWSSWIVSSDWR
jgi:CHAT domain-containing protein